MDLNIGDVAACLFPLWLCIDGYLNLDPRKEGFMKAMLATGMNALTVLWGQAGSGHAIDKKVRESLC